MVLLQALLWFLFIIGLVVFVHELGHFSAAKISGIKVEEFAFGFGKKIISKKIGETLYRINMIPLGGYVKLFGEEEKVNDPRSFSSKSIPARFFVITAGVIMNIFLAIFIFFIFIGVQKNVVYLPKISNYNFILANEEVHRKPVVAEIIEDTPASEVDFPKDVLLWKINDIDIKDVEFFQEELKKYAGQEVTIQYRPISTGQLKEINVKIAEDNGEDLLLGVRFDNRVGYFYKLDYSQYKFGSGIIHSVNFLGYNLVTFKDLIILSFEEKSPAPVAEGVVGVIGVADVILSLVKVGTLNDFLELLASINLMLALANILPIPGLDGGHIVFIALEKLLGKKVAEKYEIIGIKIGFIILITLGILITVKDIIQFDIVPRTINYIKNLF